MISIKEYIKECITYKTDIVIKSEHLSSITYVDICMIIHFIEKTENITVYSDDARIRRFRDDIYSGYVIMEKPDDEKLCILAFISMDMYKYVRYIDLCGAVGQFGVRSRYEMSQKFIDAAILCGILGHGITINIISSFSMKYEISYEEADDYLNYYMGSQKSARQ